MLKYIHVLRPCCYRTVERHILEDNSIYSEPVSNVAKDDVAKEAANIEEGGGNMRPLGIVAHQVKLSHQCVRIL